jgi:hypothetical protein
MKRFGSNVRGIDRGLATFGRTLGVIGGAAGLALFTRSLISTASAAEETRGKFNVVFRDLAGSAQRWAQEFGASVGRATHDVEAWMAGLQDTFVPLGIARAEAADLSKSLVKLAVDVGSFNNVASAEVIRDFTSALVGNHETVRKYGIIIGQTALQQAAYRAGIQKTYSALTDLEKVQLRYQLIQEGTTDAQGDAIRTADSYANQVQRLSANWANMKVQVGTLIVSPLADVIKDINWLLSTGLPSLQARYDRLQQKAPRGVLPELELGRDTGDTTGFERFDAPWLKNSPTSTGGPPKTSPRAPLRPTSLPSAAKRRMSVADYAAHKAELTVQEEKFQEHKLRLTLRGIKRTEDAYQDHVRKTAEISEQLQEKWRQVGHTMEHSLTNAADRLVFETGKASDVVIDTLRQIVREIARVQFFQPLTQGIMRGFGVNQTPAPAATPVTIEGSRHGGGHVPTTGLYKLHADEWVSRAGQRPTDPAGPVQLQVELVNQGNSDIRMTGSETAMDGGTAMTRIFINDMNDGGEMRQRLESLGLGG